MQRFRPNIEPQGAHDTTQHTTANNETKEAKGEGTTKKAKGRGMKRKYKQQCTRYRVHEGRDRRLHVFSNRGGVRARTSVAVRDADPQFGERVPRSIANKSTAPRPSMDGMEGRRWRVYSNKNPSDSLAASNNFSCNTAFDL